MQDRRWLVIGAGVVDVRSVGVKDGLWMGGVGGDVVEVAGQWAPTRGLLPGGGGVQAENGNISLLASISNKQEKKALPLPHFNVLNFQARAGPSGRRPVPVSWRAKRAVLGSWEEAAAHRQVKDKVKALVPGLPWSSVGRGCTGRRREVVWG